MTEPRRLRILIVTRNLPPLVGGMERLNWHMADELSKAADVRVIGPEGSAKMAASSVTVREAPLGPLWKFLARARSLARKEARSWKPDLVLAGSGLTAPIARSAARACGARTAVYVHGLDVAVRHLAYRAVWLPAIRRADRVIANSHATAELCRGVGIDPARIGIVHPGVDLPGAIEPETGGGDSTRHLEPLSLRETGRGESADARDATSFRQRNRFGDRPLLLSVGRLSARKGLREFVTQCLPRIIAAKPDSILLIAGDTPNQALHAEAQTPESIQAAADAAGVGECIRFLGKVPDGELASLYQTVDVHVFPVREIPNDPEGFGMVAVEAASYGLPTVAYATGGVVDAVAEGRSGYLVRQGDYTALVDAVLRTLSVRDALRDSCIKFARRFAWPEFGRQIFRQLDLDKTASGAGR